MIKKIGISSSVDKDSSIFSFKSYKNILTPKDGLPPFERIHNIIINNEIINQRVIGNNIIVVISLEIKVIYTSYLGSTLYVFKDNIISAQRIKIPSYISQEVISAIKNNSILANIFISDIEGEIQKDKSISIGYFITSMFPTIGLSNIKFIASFNNLNKNIFLWDIVNSKVTQQSFLINENIEFVLSPLYSNDFLFISNNNNDEKTIYKLSNNKLEKALYPYYMFNPIYIEQGPLNTHFIIWKDRDKVSLSLILDGIEIKSYKDLELDPRFNIIFNSKLNSLLYLEISQGKRKLTYSNLILEDWDDEKYSLDIDIEIYEEDISFYSLSDSGKYIIYVVSGIRVFLYSIEEKLSEELYILVNRYKVKEIKFSRNEEILFLLLQKNNCDDIYAYNIESKSLRSITENLQGTEISDFTLDYLGSFIYISDNSTGGYNLYKVSLRDLEIKDVLPLDSTKIKLL